MIRQRIYAERITHPFQLMAAWFVMLIILSGVILTAAYEIKEPHWITPFLVISDIVLCLIVMMAVFMMLTKFRPHLQGPREYAEWLKDERKFRVQRVEYDYTEIPFLERAHRGIPGTFATETYSRKVIESSADPANYPILISNLKNGNKVLQKVRELGFKAEIYNPDFESQESLDNEGNQAIWLGSDIPPQVALPAIKSVIEIWPFLKYLHLSADGISSPSEIHREIYFGGATDTALEYGLSPWKVEEIQAIPDTITLKNFHKVIRAKYNIQNQK